MERRRWLPVGFSGAVAAQNDQELALIRMVVPAGCLGTVVVWCTSGCSTSWITRGRRTGAAAAQNAQELALIRMMVPAGCKVSSMLMHQITTGVDLHGSTTIR